MTAVDDAATAFTPSLSLGSFTPIAAPRGAESLPRTVVTPRTSATLERRQLWERRYRRLVHVTDIAIIAMACGLASFVSLQLDSPAVLADDPWVLARLPLITAAGWLLMLALFNTRAADAAAAGATQYKGVAHATGLAFGILAIAFVVFQWNGIRTQLLLALPLGLLALLVGRWSWRRWLLRQRAYGHYVSRALVVGEREDVEYVIRTLGPSGTLGYLVVGASMDDTEQASMRVDDAIYPVMGNTQFVSGAAAALQADTIIVASRPHDDADYVKRLSWQLEGTAAELVLSSGLADVAGPRISLRPVEGLPLIAVKIPTFEGGTHVLKRALDIVVSALALIVFAPIGLLIAAAITADDGGPVFFRQKRVGRDGREFKMVKFRSMRTTAEAERTALMDANEGAGPLFKLKADPRVTRVGAFLRKYSLDEVPQFWNVLVGDMSVVGPRPPLPSEVQTYDGRVFRRLYIKPGITGLWQVSGRSNLSWEESVRLDLGYVENWSVITDLIIMWRTAKVMIKPEGAY